MEFMRASDRGRTPGQDDDADHSAVSPAHRAYRPSDWFAIERPDRVDSGAGAKSIVYIREPIQILKYENGALPQLRSVVYTIRPLRTA
jgi:hypothetical protein